MSSTERKRDSELLACLKELKVLKSSTDIDSVCQIIHQKYGTDKKTTTADIHRLLQAGTIMTEEQSGVVNYLASPHKIKRGRPPTSSNGSQDNTKKENSLWIAKSVKEVNQANGQTGAAFDIILECLKNRDAPTELLDAETLTNSLEAELQAGKVRRDSAGLYHSVRKRGRPFGSGVKRQVEETSKRGKVINSKRKRIKKSHADFEFYDEPTQQDNVAEAKCDFCLCTAKRNRKGEYEELLCCKDCPAKAHASCMDYSTILSRRAHMSPWQCIDCKTCCMCLDSGDPDDILFCDACDKGYHMSCHNPMITEKPNDKWACSACAADGVTPADLVPPSVRNTTAQMYNETSNGANGSTETLKYTTSRSKSSLTDTTSEPTQSSSSSNNSSQNNSLTAATDLWTVDNVVQYITKCGFPDEAKRFKEQEIDGKSLLLLMRDDVIASLSLRLGPAVKIYEKIKILQSNPAKYK